MCSVEAPTRGSDETPFRDSLGTTSRDAVGATPIFSVDAPSRASVCGNSSSYSSCWSPISDLRLNQFSEVEN